MKFWPIPNTSANSVDPDEVAYNMLSHQNLHCHSFIIITDYLQKCTCPDSKLEESTPKTKG